MKRKKERLSIDQLIGRWMRKRNNPNRDVVVISLIQQKQFLNLTCEGL